MLGHLLLLIVLVSSAPAWAGIIISGTRVIYPSDKREVTINLTNKGQSASLVQSWIDTGDPTVSPTQVKAPFIIIPPITRVDGGKGQTLRLIFTGGVLPVDRESVFWLNVLAVPPKRRDDNNYLKAAYQSRLKIFYRPQQLAGTIEDAISKIKFNSQDKSLSVINPTPFYISLVDISWRFNSKDYALPGKMLAPFTSWKIDEKVNKSLIGVKTVHIKYINDYGAVKQDDIFL